jgi:putative tricarboxylic transport membrane protein
VLVSSFPNLAKLFRGEFQPVKKTYLINDLVWISFAVVVCLGGLKLGFGSFHSPQAGFMPFLVGMLLGVLAVVDLLQGFLSKWERDKSDRAIWADIHWGKLLVTLGVLILYTALFSTLGFIIGTFLLLLFLYQIMQRRSWAIVLVASAVTTGLFYLAFKVGLDSQLPRGFLGF